MFSYFENGKPAFFDVFCLNFSIETKIKTIFLISYFNLSKNRNGASGTRIPKSLPLTKGDYILCSLVSFWKTLGVFKKSTFKS